VLHLTDLVERKVPGHGYHGLSEFVRLLVRCISTDPIARPNFAVIGSELRVLLYDAAKTQKSLPQEANRLSVLQSPGAYSSPVCPRYISYRDNLPVL
jgi:hypothetical protein